MGVVFVEFTTVNKYGVERYLLSFKDVVFLGETKNGCCVQRECDGCTYDVINAYNDVKKTFVDNGIKVIDLPIPKSKD